MSEYKIPIYRPFLTSQVKANLNECFDSSWISSKGKFIESFERKFSEYIGCDDAVTVTNGTVALHLALLALDLKAGDEVILPSFTYIASANAIKYLGAKAVFVDIEETSWNIDPKEIKKAITEKTRAIMCVHIYGNPCDMIELKKICDEYDLKLIEDCAEATGSLFHQKHVGNFGHISTFSFFGNKTLTTGEGGMVTSNDPLILNRIRKLKNQSVSEFKEYWHDELGYNYRMTNICAAIGDAQIDSLDEILEKKRNIAERYIKNLDQIKTQQITPKSESSYWLNAFQFKDSNTVKKIREALKVKKIETRPCFPPIHKMPYLATSQVLKNTEKISNNGICFPSYPELELNIIDEICECIIKNYA